MAGLPDDLGVAAPAEQRDETLPRLVFLATPGPGGGGGGGGFRQPAPPPKAQMKGRSIQRSPVTPPRPITRRPPDPEPKKVPPPVRPEPVARPIEPPPVPAPAPLPQVVAPVATAPADTRDRAGALADVPSDSDSHGSGSGSGVGTGQGPGIGEGTGAGIGPGTGGGTGGGPYRPGSGITAPGLLREVRPDYTEEARRRGLEGDVVLEIVVRSDGTVGDIKVLQGLGGGLNQRAIDAVPAVAILSGAALRHARGCDGRSCGRVQAAVGKTSFQFRVASFQTGILVTGNW